MHLKNRWKTSFGTFFQFAEMNKLSIKMYVNNAIVTTPETNEDIEKTIDECLVVKPESFKDSNYVWDDNHEDVVAIKNILYVKKGALIKSFPGKEIKTNEFFISRGSKEKFDKKHRNTTGQNNRKKNATKKTESLADDFTHDDDYMGITVCGRKATLTERPASVLKHLHEEYLNKRNKGFIKSKDVRKAAGCPKSRMNDIFKKFANVKYLLLEFTSNYRKVRYNFNHILPQKKPKRNKA